MSSERFYETLAAFEEFNEFVEFEAYIPVPDDWVVVLTDVRGSTEAIRAGRYKDVNMAGAATITAVLNTCGEIEVPFVFGGDGGTVVVPGSLRTQAEAALAELRAACGAMFGLELRAGSVPVSTLRAKGSDLRVRKHLLSPGNHLAMFAGGGLELADALLKSDDPDNPYLLAEAGEEAEPNLEGLSCRWEPLTPKDGCMLTLMVQGRSASGVDESLVLAETLTAISAILGHGLRDSAPASGFSMRFRWPPKGALAEARAIAPQRGYWRALYWVLFTSFVQFWCELLDRKAGDYDGATYRDEVRTNTDFRKYDGILRTVLDVTERQAGEIERYLERGYASGRLVYGAHRSDQALMTCLLFNMSQGEHVHFIDGANGGFAMAAAGFKKRLATLGAA